MKIKKPTIIKYSIYPEFNGTLVPFYINKSFPKKFKLKRFFLLYGKKKFPRADHAHKKCSQIIIPLRGKIKIEIISYRYKKIFNLDLKKKEALYIPTYNWIKINFKSDEDSLLTLCNYEYDKNEYILEFNNFKKIISK
tara:strand:- start:1193 stop:1606 length:414 start_codon:yes stop_codon:yes gene_type:complete